MDVLVVWLLGMYNDLHILHLVEVTIDLSDMIKMSSLRLHTKTGQCHDCHTDIKSSNRDSPLHCSDKRLILLGVIIISKKLQVINLWMVAFLEWQ